MGRRNLKRTPNILIGATVITITNSTQSETPNLIQEIKYLRQWLEERYGVIGGLKECKEFIEHIKAMQEDSPVFKVKELITTMSFWEKIDCIKYINSVTKDGIL